MSETGEWRRLMQIARALERDLEIEPDKARQELLTQQIDAAYDAASEVYRYMDRDFDATDCD